jgi:hypothetical protein
MDTNAQSRVCRTIKLLVLGNTGIVHKKKDYMIKLAAILRQEESLTY